MIRVPKSVSRQRNMERIPCIQYARTAVPKVGEILLKYLGNCPVWAARVTISEEVTMEDRADPKVLEAIKIGMIILPVPPNTSSPNSIPTTLVKPITFLVNT